LLSHPTGTDERHCPPKQSPPEPHPNVPQLEENLQVIPVNDDLQTPPCNEPCSLPVTTICVVDGSTPKMTFFEQTEDDKNQNSNDLSHLDPEPNVTNHDANSELYFHHVEHLKTASHSDAGPFYSNPESSKAFDSSNILNPATDESYNTGNTDDQPPTPQNLALVLDPQAITTQKNPTGILEHHNPNKRSHPEPDLNLTHLQDNVKLSPLHDDLKTPNKVARSLPLTTNRSNHVHDDTTPTSNVTNHEANSTLHFHNELITPPCKKTHSFYSASVASNQSATTTDCNIVTPAAEPYGTIHIDNQPPTTPANPNIFIPVPLVMETCHNLPNNAFLDLAPPVSDCTLIQDLHTNMPSKWKIRAAVVNVQAIVLFTNKNTHAGSRRFSFSILDESGVTMRITCFDQALTKFFDTIKIGNVYTIENAIIKESKYHDNCNANFELILTVASILTPTTQTSLDLINESVSSIQKEIIPIQALALNKYHWIIFGTIANKTSKRFFNIPSSGGQGTVFNITINDDAGASIRGTFFAEAAEKFYDILEFGERYSFSDANVISANTQYSPKHPIELKFGPNSKIQFIDPVTIPGDLPSQQSFRLISDLEPKNIHNWPIAARVLYKSKVSQWQNEQTDGLLFHITLCDSSGVDVRANFFDAAAEKFFDNLHIGNVYVFSGGNVQVPRYSDDRASHFVINFNVDTFIQPFVDFEPNIIHSNPEFFNLATLQDLAQKQHDDVRKYDILAIVTSVGPLEPVADLICEPPHHHCHVTIIDSSRHQPSTVTLFGHDATLANTSFHNNPVVAFCPVSIYTVTDVRQFRCVGNIILNPTGDLAVNLKEWWKNRPIVEDPLPMIIQPLQQPPCVVITPVANLSKSGAGHWTICGRIFHKSGIVEVHKGPNKIQLFTISILDSSGVDILGKFETQTVVQHFYDAVQVGQVYCFSNALLQTTNPYKKTGCISPLEICFNMASIVSPNQDKSEHLGYNFRTLRELADIKGTAKIKADLIAVVTAVGTLIQHQSAPHLDHCDLVVADDSDVKLTLTVWGDVARNANSRFLDHPVVGFYPVRIKLFGDAQLAAVGQVVDSPDSPRSQHLHDWWSQKTNNDILFE